MAFLSGDDASPLSPKGQFVGRYNKGLGVGHRGRDTGTPDIFANTPLEVMNNREFCCFWQDFMDNYETDTTNVWELTEVGTATAAFTIVADSPNGLSFFSVVELTDNFGAQIQFHPGATTAAGETIDPLNQAVVSWAMAGKMAYPLTTDWFIGISVDDTSVLTEATGVMAASDYMGFHHLEDSATVELVQSGGGTDVVVVPLVTPWTPKDAESPMLIRELGLRIDDNDKMYWYINGVCVGRTQVGATTGVDVTPLAFATKMTSTVALVNGDAGNSCASTYIDYHTWQVSRLNAPVGG